MKQDDYQRATLRGDNQCEIEIYKNNHHLPFIEKTVNPVDLKENTY